ncbi:MAG: hypothetical protein ACW97P_08275, partial [Candidatus Hodarchaeales archaeon]
MIISSYERSAIESDREFADLLAEIKHVVNLEKFDINSYFDLANSYQLPLHLVYLIIHSLKKDQKLSLTDLSSVSFYAICRDVLTPYRNKAFTFKKFFNLKYPHLRNTDERLEWYLKHENGLTLTQKISILEGETSFNRMGIGRVRFEQSLKRVNIEATPKEIELRRLRELYGEWPAAVATFIQKERGDLTAAEVLAVGNALAEDTKTSIKIAVFSELLKRMGKIEVFFLASQINKFHDQV